MLSLFFYVLYSFFLTNPLQIDIIVIWKQGK